MTSFCRPVLGNRKKMSKYLPKEGFSPPKLRKDNNFFNFVNPALQGTRRLESGLKSLLPMQSFLPVLNLRIVSIIVEFHINT